MTSHQKKIDRKTWKTAPHHMSSGKYKWKQQGNSAAHSIEWPVSRTLTTQNAGEDVK